MKLGGSTPREAESLERLGAQPRWPSVAVRGSALALQTLKRPHLSWYQLPLAVFIISSLKYFTPVLGPH